MHAAPVVNFCRIGYNGISIHIKYRETKQLVSQTCETDNEYLQADKEVSITRTGYRKLGDKHVINVLNKK